MIWISIFCNNPFRYIKCNRFIFFHSRFGSELRYHNTWYVGMQTNQWSCLLHKIFCASINIALNMHRTIRLCKRVSCGLMWKICKNITVPLCTGGYLNKTFFQIPTSHCAYIYIHIMRKWWYICKWLGVHWLNVLFNSASGFLFDSIWYNYATAKDLNSNKMRKK